MGLVGAVRGLSRRLAESQAASDNAGVYGRVAIPGSIQLSFHEGAVKLWYHEPRKVHSDGDRIDDIRPPDLKVTVAPVSGGVALEVRGPGWRGMGRQVNTRSGWTIDLHGTVDIAAPGEYTVTASGTPAPDAVEPQLLLGP